MTKRSEDPATIETEIGPRGSTRIRSSNRAAARRWLVAHGVPSAEARAMTLEQINAAYNDLSGEALAAHLDADIVHGDGDDEPAPAEPKRKAAAAQPDKIQQLAAILGDLTAGGGAPVDADEVREIVREEVQAATRTIEITAPDGHRTKIEGAHRQFETVSRMVGAGVHVWLAGPAGSGKTTLARQTAEALDLPFYSVGAVTSDFRLVGYTTATGELVRTPFREAYEHGGVFLFDEIDASHPSALVALNQALANDSYAFPDGMVERHPHFRVIAAANTYGHGATSDYVGRTKIDGATLDRFAFVPMDYDEDVEDAMAGQHQRWAEVVRTARRAVERHGIRHIISPRATEHGARLLEAGLDGDTVADAVIRKGLDADSWRKVHAEIVDSL